MKVILLKDLRQAGRRGEIVDVKPGFARNYLVPKGVAAVASNANIKAFAHQRRRIDEEHEAERSKAAELAAEMAGVTLTIAKRAGESENLYGSVTPVEIVEALAEKEIEVDRRSVDLAGGIKTLGEHVVRIDLHSDVVAEVNLKVVPEE